MKMTEDTKRDALIEVLVDEICELIKHFVDYGSSDLRQWAYRDSLKDRIRDIFEHERNQNK
jgi:hypothetical protein